MSNPILYGFTKKDLENTIELVIKRLQKTSLVHESPLLSEEDRLTQKEAAQFLGKSEQCLIKWKKQNKIPYYQIGDSPFYSKRELLEYAKRNPYLRRPTSK
ncbi:helix-turn-helix domain-containing protein [Ulvibacterium marinum]|uniref:DNA-binding protein n=1 Tax=Ulvibacterium marinum TaxID=2419782 RepID=A0A3B0CCP3_9FLAO|nr:helix-turn-helix domain-containing protein [Ulvibacterium marinum]RKN82860.1 DNA-binding protein [Ulvibacterium marinum]